MSRRSRLEVSDYVDGVLAGDRAILGRAISLVESTAARHQEAARDVLTALMPHTGGSHRVGITGVPGVGKSTFIERLGLHLIDQGHQVAVLAVDPSSTRSGGSILGDKTRMERLSMHDQAFIRPSPTSGTLGGVASRTRETLLLCEAAGYDIVLVETVGVGQSELVVAEMTDFFLVLMLAGAGDELQGIKRGLMELADSLVVNKADGDNADKAQMAASTYRSALRLLRGMDPHWKPQVLTASGLHGSGVPEVWKLIASHKVALEADGEWSRRRQAQQHTWMWSMVDDLLRRSLHNDPAVKALLPALEAEVAAGTQAPTRAAAALIEAFLRRG